jgi:predicted TIM-barrel fold metal-dependent hydrolase
VDASNLPLISADSHVSEPRMLWWDSLPESMRERAPARIRPTEDGSWELGRHQETTLTQRQKDRIEEMDRAKTTDVDFRLKIMREDGINAECVFPTIGLYIWDIEDPELGEACCQVYNDWIYDAIESKSDRHSCAALIPTWDIEHAIQEVRRISALGLGSAMLPLNGAPQDYNRTNFWDPLWTAIEEEGLTVVAHQGTGHDMLFYRGPGAAVANLVATQSMAQRNAALLATSGTLERHPGLHVVYVETNAAWISGVMDTLDFYYDAFLAQPNWVKPELKEKPSHYIAHQIHSTFQWDPTGVNNIGRTGPGALMWGSDYPHSEGTYPHSRKIVQELCADLSAEDALAMVGGNATRLFRFDPAIVTTPIPAPAIQS